MDQPTKPSPGPQPEKPAHGTSLYVARLSDPRERKAVPREVPRGRAARKAETTSDVTRFRGVIAAAVVGAGAVVGAIWLEPPAGGVIGVGAPGPLARPHVKAKLECSSCHAAPDDARTASSRSSKPLLPNACATCHGAHPSTRAGHQKLAAAGQLGCPTCHTIHRNDQGVTFTAEGAVRFAPGREAPQEGVAFRPPRKTTVPIVAAASCSGCHAMDTPRDPIARCLLGGQEGLGDARPTVCFDEHWPALPAERSPGRPSPSDPKPRAPGVCSDQHGTDRALAWDAAREAAALTPVLSGSAGSSRPWTWLGAGLFAAAIAFGTVRGARALWQRLKKRAAAAPPETLAAPPTRVRLPQIDVNTCIGCYACVDACPYDVLEIERYVAVVARPEACCGLTLCEQRCPNGSLRITDGDPIGDRPRLSEALESLDTPGLFLAGDITGLPLIKNAIQQGSRAVDRVVDSLEGAPPGSPGALDLLIVGAGPAGISAALRAKELGLSFEVLEQGSVAQSIKSFPRGKLVFDQPLELPVTGKLWLEESTKEDLLGHWMRIVRQERLPIRQDTRMTGLVHSGAEFAITAEPREGGAPFQLRARRVLLAIGQRGQPRRLPFELRPEVESKVHYHLADARSFEGKRVVIVGLGDVAMEAAIALSRQPETTVTIVHRGDDFRRGKSRNIDEIRRMIESGRVILSFGTEVRDVTPEHLVVTGIRGPRTMPYDAVLVMIGNIPPWNTLRAAGVRTQQEDRRTQHAVQGSPEAVRPA